MAKAKIVPTTSAPEAIILMCFQCNGCDAVAVLECSSTECPLNAHRPTKESEITALAKKYFTRDGDLKVEKLVVVAKAEKRPKAATSTQGTEPRRPGRPKGSKNKDKTKQEATLNDQSSAPRRKTVRDGRKPSPPPEADPPRKGVGRAGRGQHKRPKG